MTDPGRYRSRAEEELWRKRDPIPRLGKHLVKEGFADQARLDALHAEVDQIVRGAMSFAAESPAPSPEALYEDLFAGTFERG
jgi:pyruvate dehydrogenase E1 component alpha subunit